MSKHIMLEASLKYDVNPLIDRILTFKDHNAFKSYLNRKNYKTGKQIYAAIELEE